VTFRRSHRSEADTVRWVVRISRIWKRRSSASILQRLYVKKP